MSTWVCSPFERCVGRMMSPRSDGCSVFGYPLRHLHPWRCGGEESTFCLIYQYRDNKIDRWVDKRYRCIAGENSQILCLAKPYQESNPSEGLKGHHLAVAGFSWRSPLPLDFFGWQRRPTQRCTPSTCECSKHFMTSGSFQ